MKSSLRPGQVVALLCTAAAPTVLQGRVALPAIAYGTAGLLGIALLLCLPSRKKPLPRWVQAPAALAAALFFLWEAVRTAANLGHFATETEQPPATAPLLVAALVLTAAFGAAQGMESLARSSVLWAAAGILLLLPIGAALLPHTSVDALRAHTASAPERAGGFFIEFGGELALLGLLYSTAPHLRPRHVLLFGTIVGTLALACTGLAAGMLGSWGTVRAEPLYIATLSVPPDSAFRPDSLYTVIRIAAHYCRTALFLAGSGHCLRLLPGKFLHRFGVWTGTIIAVTVAIGLTSAPMMLDLLTRVSRMPVLVVGLGLLAGRRNAP